MAGPAATVPASLTLFTPARRSSGPARGRGMASPPLSGASPDFLWHAGSRTGPAARPFVVAGPVPGAGFVSEGAGAREGVFRGLQSVERQYSPSIDGPEGRLEAEHRTGANTVLETSAPPFGAGSSRVAYPAR